MTPREGIERFLRGMIRMSPETDMAAEDLEKAIEIAGKKAPSSAFDRASTYWRMQHAGTLYQQAFAKGTRWLAMLRRDEGQQAFEAECERLRQIAASWLV